MKLLQKLAEIFLGTPVQDPEARARALSRLGTPRKREDSGHTG
jgi:hypothetical protein